MVVKCLLCKKEVDETDFFLILDPIFYVVSEDLSFCLDEDGVHFDHLLPIHIDCIMKDENDIIHYKDINKLKQILYKMVSYKSVGLLNIH